MWVYFGSVSADDASFPIPTELYLPVMKLLMEVPLLLKRRVFPELLQFSLANIHGVQVGALLAGQHDKHTECTGSVCQGQQPLADEVIGIQLQKAFKHHIYYCRTSGVA